jgi:long-chain fatty acid transport protein
MAKRFTFRKILLLMSATGLVGFNQYANAAAFQLWEQDGASIGNYHAGRAASAEDASIAFYNPAGLVRIKNQQIVLGVDPIVTDIRFHGTIDVNTAGLGSSGPATAASQGGGLNFVPSFNYAAPISDRFVFGFSLVGPFGLKTDYGTSAATRYAATLTSLQVVDYSPSLGVAITPKLSVGAGFDIQRANAEFDLVAGNSLLDTIFGSSQDTAGQNTGADHAYGYHAGVMYQFTPQTRLGLAYNSKVTHILHGSSHFAGPLANDGTTGPAGVQLAPSLRTKIDLPPTTTLSLFHSVNPAWDVMGTLIYTKWDVIQNLVLTGVAAITGGNSSNNVTVTIPQNYKNTWNYSVGTNYHVNEKWMLRAGVGFDQTPSNDKDRNLQLPDSNRLALALGTHFQPTKTIGLDVGWTHLIAMNTRINNTVVVGDQSSTVVGSVDGGADVYGLQLRWDIL